MNFGWKDRCKTNSPSIRFHTILMCNGAIYSHTFWIEYIGFPNCCSLLRVVINIQRCSPILSEHVPWRFLPLSSSPNHIPIKYRGPLKKMSHFKPIYLKSHMWLCGTIATQTHSKDRRSLSQAPCATCHHGVGLSSILAPGGLWWGFHKAFGGFDLWPGRTSG